jgi:peptide/nickel transport system substrate-binding protein
LAEEEVRYGAWVDEIIGIVVDDEVAVAMLKAGEIHIFAEDIACAETFARVMASPELLGYEPVFGRHFWLALNPAGTPENPVFRDGRLNPFAVPRIREALQWLIDRDYIAEEIWAGLGMPRYFAISPIFPDYARLIETARRLEIYYAHNPEKAREIIFYEMEKLGAELIDGIWHWKVGEELKPVEIILVIRNDDERLGLGHYMTRLIENVGFKTKQHLVGPGETAPFWARGEPYDGKFHIFTGSSITTLILRDQAPDINIWFTPLGTTWPQRLALKPTPELADVSRRLRERDFADMEERNALFARALELSMEDSARIFVVNTTGFMTRRAEIEVAACLAGGISVGYLWPYTLRFRDQVGGTVRVGMPDILVDPWNPIAGTGWAFDVMFIRATTDWAMMPGPFTGLDQPQRIERAEVYVKEGLPVMRTLDGVSLHFVPEYIQVPLDVWVDWCAVEQRFITLAEAKEKEGFDPDRLTAKVMVRVHYPADLFETVKWHCGSPLTIGDFVADMIFGFDWAKKDGLIFNPGVVPGFEHWLRLFRGFRIVSKDPLVIESFTEVFHMDAEWMAWTWTWWPGGAAWHNIVPGMLAEANRELAFRRLQAVELKVEWTSYIAGPSLPILERHLREAKAANFIPWAPTLAQFITPEEAALRYANLLRWFEERGHFWVGMGPFYLYAAHYIERIVHLRRNPYFPDRADKWDGFVTPKTPELDLTGPAVVRAGDEATFAIEMTFAGEPYLVAYIDKVLYLLIDALGEIVYTGEAVAIADGLWQVVLPAEKTAALAVGTTMLEVVVLPQLVSKPAFTKITFMLLP